MAECFHRVPTRWRNTWLIFTPAKMVPIPGSLTENQWGHMGTVTGFTTGTIQNVSERASWCSFCVQDVANALNFHHWNHSGLSVKVNVFRARRAWDFIGTSMQLFYTQVSHTHSVLQNWPRWEFPWSGRTFLDGLLFWPLWFFTHLLSVLQSLTSISLTPSGPLWRPLCDIPNWWASQASENQSRSSEVLLSSNAAKLLWYLYQTNRGRCSKLVLQRSLTSSL